jgi:hypothetical protein
VRRGNFPLERAGVSGDFNDQFAQRSHISPIKKPARGHQRSDIHFSSSVASSRFFLRTPFQHRSARFYLPPWALNAAADICAA